MNELQIIEQREVLGRHFTMYGDFDNPLFLAKDVAEWIEYDVSSVNKLVGLVDDDERALGTLFREGGGTYSAWFLTEDGLYEVLMQSRKPIAKQFKNEVKNILKSIRKTGAYNLTPTELIAQLANNAVELERKLTVQEEKITAIEQTVQDIEHTVQESAERLDKTIKTFSSPSYDNWKLDMSLAIAELVKVRNIPEPRLKGFIYAELEQSGVSLQSRVNRLKERMKKQGATYKQRMAITKLDVISNDKKLRPIFEGIIKKYQVTA